MKTTTFRGARSVYALIAGSFLLAAALPIFLGRADAAVFATRSIQMSDATPSAASVQYDLTVTPTAGTVLGLVIEFCDNGPILGDSSCTGAAGVALPNLGSAVSAGWTKDAASTTTKLVFTRVAGSWTNTPTTVSITGVTNPSNVGLAPLGTFYARVASYDTAAKAVGYTTANPSAVGAPTDTGGFALSTSSKLTVTAKVQEKLVFCVYTLADCTTGGTAVILGLNGVLDEAIPYNNYDTKFDVSTNAQSGVTIRAKTFASPGHTLTSGAGPTITAIGAAAAASSTGSEQFGVCFVGAGTLAGVSPYDSATCNGDITTGAYSGGAAVNFAWDSGGTGTASTFGDDLASAPSALTTTVGHLNFIGNISLTTEAGIYTTDISLIATGKF